MLQIAVEKLFDDIIKNGFPVTDIDRDSAEFRRRFRKLRKETHEL